MAMSRKDYEAIAAALKGVIEDAADGHETVNAINDAAERLADVFADDNDRFDRARFMQAVGV